MYIFEDIVYFPGVCLVQLHSSELSSSSSQHPENREIAQRCARTVYIFEEDCVCFECQTILPNCHPHHQLYSRQFSPIVIPTISYIQGCSSTQTFPRLFLTEKKNPFICQNIAILVQMYKISSLSIAFLDQLICNKKVGMASSLSRSSCGIIFLPGPGHLSSLLNTIYWPRFVLTSLLQPKSVLE